MTSHRGGAGDEPIEDAPAREERRFDQGRVILLILLLLTIGYSVLALRYPRGGFTHPGPGLVPLVAGAITVVLITVGLFVRPRTDSTLPTEEDEVSLELVDPSPWRYTLIFLGVLIAYVLILQTVGQLLASTVMVLSTLLICRGRPLWQMAVITVVTAVTSFLLFAFVLNVPLPTRIIF